MMASEQQSVTMLKATQTDATYYADGRVVMDYEAHCRTDDELVALQRDLMALDAPFQVMNFRVVSFAPGGYYAGWQIETTPARSALRDPAPDPDVATVAARGISPGWTSLRGLGTVPTPATIPDPDPLGDDDADDGSSAAGDTERPPIEHGSSGSLRRHNYCSACGANLEYPPGDAEKEMCLPRGHLWCPRCRIARPADKMPPRW